MSMIGSLIDELRKSADEWNGSNMFELARMCSDAADTIWELRCRLVDAEDRVRKSGELCKLCEREAENAKLQNDADLLREMLQAKRQETHALMAENAKLREEVVELRKSSQTYDAENAKLRELCRDTNKAAHMLCEAWEGSCSKEAEGMSLHAVCSISDTSELCVFGKLYDRMRELGIEVDG